MHSSKPIVLSTAYLPNLEYLLQIVNREKILVERYDHFIKQTYRNRCDIITANGKLTLSIPLIKHADKELISQKRISYRENWQQQHWRSIVSAYKSSPYFEFFEDELKPFYEKEYEFLIDYNSELLKTILKILRHKKEIQFTTHYETHPENTLDLRDFRSIHILGQYSPIPYYQVFAHKSGFVPHLSCIDALFHVGLKTLELIRVPTLE